MNSDIKDRIRLCVEQTLQESETPGAAIALYIKGQPFLEMGIGYQDLEQEIPLPADSTFYIYSITKSLLATVALNLIDRGRLDLNASVKPYVSNFPLDESITLRQLLSHTSGLPDYGEVTAYFEDLKAKPRFPWSTTKFLNLARSQGLKFPPGEGWAYSNIGYLLLKLHLEQVTNLPIQKYIENIIFNPLNLKKTFVANTLEDVRGLTPGYSNFFSDNELQDVIRFYHPGWVSHGVIASTAPELAKIIDSLFAGKILNPSLVEQMLCPIHIFAQKHPLFDDVGYGLGLCLSVDSPYGKMAGHNGAGPGYSVAAYHFPSLLENSMTFVALANRDRQDLDLGSLIIFRMIKTLEK
jgi:D-alanyl-D-alanine carboxypeptidase